MSHASDQSASPDAPPKTSISPSEWEVLNIVWKHQPITAAQVVEQLPAHLEWHPKTVGTFLIRLVDKQVLAVEKQGKVNLYTARLTREQCIATESENFLRRVFRGATKPLLAHFAERADLTEQDIAELKALLDQKRSGESAGEKGAN